MRRASIVAAAGLLAAVFLPAVSLAQNSATSEPPGVEVLKFSWSVVIVRMEYADGSVWPQP
ncbi:MAG TPA: hypothetical protein VD861_16645 [Pyrinomonadaceae bacterium]|nr:hypothetical protein [Pyrinomonadaceae bacterium]